MIFINHNLNEKIFEHCANNDYSGLKYVEDTFNQDVSKLPKNLTHLCFCGIFEKDVSNLPKNLTLSYEFN